MPEIVIRIRIPNKSHRPTCWCRECGGAPDAIRVEWSAIPSVEKDGEAFCGSVSLQATSPRDMLNLAVHDAVDQGMKAAGIGPPARRPWLVGDRVRLNTAKYPRAIDLIGTVKKLLPDGRPYVLWPDWPANISDLPPYLHDDLILVEPATLAAATAPPAG